ncbi:MAG: Fic family protein [Deltaproteobacteria bacterium]|nr:Fic family protein [Deltaproteobacteria bacterium]
MATYLWQRPDWPTLLWKAEALMEPLAAASRAQGRLYGELGALGFEGDRQEAEAQALVEEAVTTSAIEGERLPREEVRSSVARRLGLDAAGLRNPSRHVDGLVSMLLDATSRYDEPLTADRLKSWQAALFPTGYSGLAKIRVGQWREGPMSVLSGPVGREREHFEAPPAERLDEEVARFLRWWEASWIGVVGLVRAGVAHLWFETIHPFDDGNGRVGRALTEMALAQADARRRRFYSLSSQIHRERDDYYRVLEAAQKGDGDVTEWLAWFLGCVLRAVEAAAEEVAKALERRRFWQSPSARELNARQVKAISRLLDAGPGGFEGGLTNQKYRGMTKASKVTATRDLADLLSRGLLLQSGQGRGTRYELNWTLLGGSKEHQ